MKKSMIYIVSTVLIIAAIMGYGIYSRINNDDTDKNTKKKDADKAVVAVPVKTIIAQKKDLIKYIHTTGTAKAIKEMVISPKISGDIEKIYIHENSYVKRGTPIFKMDNRDYKLNLEQAKNDLISAKIEYGIRKKQDNDFGKEKKKDVKPNGNIENVKKKLLELENDLKANKISQEDYKNEKLNLEIDELFAKGNRDELLKYFSGLSGKYISYEKAKLNYNYTIVKAPFSGYISNLNIVEGQNINAGLNCASLVDISTIKIEIPVLESEIGDLKIGRNVTSVFDAYPNKEFIGKIKYISPVIDETTKTCKIEVHIDNSKKLIKPGMNTNVKIEGMIYKNRLIVPKEALIVRDNRKLIFIVENNKSKWLYVKTGLENDNYIEILTKLKEGMEVVVSNNYTLAHDANVEVVK